jgi:hypothetical protein
MAPTVKTRSLQPLFLLVVVVVVAQMQMLVYLEGQAAEVEGITLEIIQVLALRGKVTQGETVPTHNKRIEAAVVAVPRKPEKTEQLAVMGAMESRP